MRLNVKERLLVLNLLPAENNFVTLKIIRKLQAELSFTEEEIKKIEFKQDGAKISWNPKKEFEKEIEIGGTATEIIAGVLKKKDKENKLTMDFMSIYEKFIND